MTTLARQPVQRAVWARSESGGRSRVDAARSLRRFLWPGLLLFAAVGVLLANLTARSSGVPGQAVRLSEVSRGPLSVEVLATGTVQPTERFELRYPDAWAEVDAVLVEAGQVVEAGQPLVRLVTRPLLEEVQRARSAYLEAAYRLADLRSGRREVKLRSLELALERTEGELKFREVRRTQVQELARAGLVSRADEAQAEHDLAGARLALEEARLQLSAERRGRRAEEEASLEAELRYRRLALERAEAALGRAALKSPGAGAVLEIPVHRGTLLRQGDLVAAVADVSRFGVSALVDEIQVGRLRIGQPVWIRNEFFGESELHGAIERIVPNVRRGERGVPSVEIVVAVRGGAWKPPAGLTVDVGVRIEQTGDVTRVPLEAVVERQGRSVVFVYDAGRARLQPIKVGLRNDTAVEVLDGLAPGRRVLTAGHTLLQGGEAVRPLGGDASGALQVEFFR